MRKLKKFPIYSILIASFLLNLAGCSNKESQDKQQLDSLKIQSEWVPIPKKLEPNNTSSSEQIELQYHEKNIHVLMSCIDKSIHITLTLQNILFTTTVVYVAEKSKWVKGTYFALHRKNHPGRPKHLAVQRVGEDNIFDLNIPIAILVKEGDKLDSIEAKLLDGDTLLILFDELASLTIDNCIKK